MSEWTTGVAFISESQSVARNPNLREASADDDASKNAIAAAIQAGRLTLTEPTAKALLRNIGIDVPHGVVINEPHEARAALARLKPPFVGKIVSPNILHKSDIDGVRLNLVTADALETAIAEMAKTVAQRSAPIDGYLLEEMAPAGIEIAVGGLIDPSFGPMIMAGMGGIHIEVFNDVAYRICPITEDEAREMLDELRCARLFDGFRGAPAVSRSAIVDLLVKIGGADGFLMRHAQDILELDLNPVIVSSTRAVAADATIVLREKPPRASAEHDGTAPKSFADPLQDFRPLFEPQTVAVVGASATGANAANTFIRRMRAYGFTGSIYPIHPEASEVEGLPAYSSLLDTPRPADYAYIAVAGARVPALLSAAPGRVRFAQVIASGFGETESGAPLEGELVRAARAGGCRVLGPNCLGTFSPRGNLTFPVTAPRDVGTIGVLTQSGGLGTDIIKRGQSRGLKFSGLVSLGNSADVKPADLLEFYLADPKTRIIGLYLEDGKDGRRFFDILRSSQTQKPVVLMKGGRTKQGSVAAASHTGALAGNDRAWIALTEQTPTVMVSHLDGFIDVLLTLQFLDFRCGHPIERIALFGNGGGTSVLATDQFATEGIDIAPFSDGVRKRLEALSLPSGTSVTNPVDAPVRSLQQDDGHVAEKILDIIYQCGEVDAVVMHLNLASFAGREGVDPIENLIATATTARQRSAQNGQLVLVLRSDGSKELDDLRRHYRTVAIERGVPVFDELAPTAAAIGAIRTIQRKLANRK